MTSSIGSQTCPSRLSTRNGSSYAGRWNSNFGPRTTIGSKKASPQRTTKQKPRRYRSKLPGRRINTKTQVLGPLCLSELSIPFPTLLPLTENPYHAQAEALLQLIRSRPKADEVVRRAQSFCEEVASTHTLDLVKATSVVRTISVQVLLHVGARSFSHFLNAVERYLALLKFFSKDTDAKAEILDAASAFWNRNFQMVTIVFDKLMQYQIVDPSDVVAWAFRDGQGVRAKGWDVLKAALAKASGRVAVAKAKVQKVRKDEEDAKAKVKATKGEVLDEGMDVEEGEPVWAIGRL